MLLKHVTLTIRKGEHTATVNMFSDGVFTSTSCSKTAENKMQTSSEHNSDRKF